ncbi:hypothetical protein CEXT_201771 [Caerostris extrusa]|uniref:Uncharacterized protein n=1 Tax=Caerostris extrusa TaxID=172846 RepID=A0AAV4V2B2_CAEEX|nr:hypothetical protein CEXT_201771 [Caerostris extrusa]
MHEQIFQHQPLYFHVCKALDKRKFWPSEMTGPGVAGLRDMKLVASTCCEGGRFPSISLFETVTDFIAFQNRKNDACRHLNLLEVEKESGSFSCFPLVSQLVRRRENTMRPRLFLFKSEKCTLCLFIISLQVEKNLLLISTSSLRVETE